MGMFAYDDGQVEKRSVAQDEAVAKFLHHQLVPLLNRIVVDPIKASYCYLAVYEPGAVLTRHTDRPQCQWNLSMPLDADPETDATSAWPIYLEVDGKPREVRLGLGDAVLYRGTELFHWRDAQPAGHRCTVCFFHFVSDDFEGSLH
jgi:alkylated DNA repair dioxygenase AlkB